MILNVANNFNFDYIIFAIIIVLMVASMLIVYVLYKQNKQLINELNKRNNIEIDSSNKDSESNRKNSLDDGNQDMIDLQNITKSLEALPKEKNIDFNSYEAEQEEKAIISYDELLEANKKVSINYSEENNVDDILVKKVDLDNTGKIELDPIKKELNSKVELMNYEHEEAFLKALKQLQSLLN